MTQPQTSQTTQTNVVNMKGYDEKLLAIVNEARNNIQELKAERSEINNRITAELDSLEKYGFNRKAIKAAFQYLEIDEDHRENYDLTMAFIRQAGGMPIQDDLFEAVMRFEAKEFEEEIQH